MMRQLSPQKTQAGKCTRARLGKWDVPTLVSDAKRRQSKTAGRNIRHNSVVLRAYVASIFHQTGLWIGLFPKVENVGFLYFFEKLVILWRKAGRCRRRGGTQVLFLGHQERHNPRSSEGQAKPDAEDTSEHFPAGQILTPGRALRH